MELGRNVPSSVINQDSMPNATFLLLHMRTGGNLSTGKTTKTSFFFGII